MKWREITDPPLWVVNVTAFGAMLTLSLFLVSIYATERIDAMKNTRSEAARALPSITVLNVLKEDPFENLQIKAKAAVVFDVSRNKTLYSFNSEDQLPLASLTKLMTAVVASETLPSYTAIEIVPRSEERDTRLKVGERWPLTELLEYMLITSSNSSADSVAAAAASYLSGSGTQNISENSGNLSLFIEDMNKKAQELGLNQTYFLNPSGLDTNPQVSGAYGSAQDVALLITYILKNHPNLLNSTGRLEETFSAPDGREISVTNTNEHVGEIPGLIGSKTGLTDLAGGNLALAFDASFAEPFVIVVLNSSESNRFDDASKLVQATIQYLGSGMKIPRGVSTPAPATLNDISYNINL